MKYLFCNIGWMKHYQGNTDVDQIFGGGSYVDKNEIGFEVCNFAPYRNKVFGYVQPVGAKDSNDGGQIKLEKIVNADADSDSESEQDVFVIWTATRPDGGTVVIGWYKNATVFRKWQKIPASSALHKENAVDDFRIQAKAQDTKLLSLEERTIFILRGKDGMGQSPVWYGQSEPGKKVAQEIYKIASGKKIKKVNSKKKSRVTDPKHNAEVERAAVNKVWEYYEGLGYSVISVEKDNVGWDIEATQGKIKLEIEVKGLSGKEPNIQLSPNEYTAFKEYKSNYRLAIVTQALLNNKQKLYICHYSSRQTWEVIDNDQLSIDTKEQTGATVKIIT